MEYSRSFALIEAVALVALTAWLYYLNTSGSGSSSDAKDGSQEDENERARSDEGS